MSRLSTSRRPRNLQATSGLIQLPAELRLKILRFLLKADKPIQSLTKHYWNMFHPYLPLAQKDFEQSVQLSAQILACSQTLHEEARQILYEENVLVIRFDNHPYLLEDRFKCLPNKSLAVPCLAVHVFGCTAAMKASAKGLDSNMFSLLPQIEGQTNAPTPFFELKPVWQHHFRNHFMALKSFQNIHVDMQFDLTDECMFMICTISRDLLRDKSVTLSAPNLIDYLEPCQYLRCRSLALDDCSVRDARVARICQLVTSGSSVENFAQKARNFIKELTTCTAVDPFGKLFTDVYDLGKLEHAVFIHDPMALRKAQHGLLLDVQSWNEDCADQERELAESHRNDAEYDLRCAKESQKTAQEAEEEAEEAKEDAEDELLEVESRHEAMAGLLRQVSSRYRGQDSGAPLE